MLLGAIHAEFLQREVKLVRDAPATPMREADRTSLDAEGGAQWIRQEKMASVAPAGTFFDYAPVHLLTIAALRQLKLDHANGGDGASDARRFRPHLRTLARHNCVASVTAMPGHIFQASLGVYAQVIEAGDVRVGDPFALVGEFWGVI